MSLAYHISVGATYGDPTNWDSHWSNSERSRYAAQMERDAEDEATAEQLYPMDADDMLELERRTVGA